MQKQTLLLRWFSMASVYWLPACKTSRCRTKFLYVQEQEPSEHLGNALFEVRVLHFPARMKLSQAPQSVHRVASPVEEVEEKDGLKKQVSDHTVGWTGQRQICWAQTCTTFVGWSPPRTGPITVYWERCGWTETWRDPFAKHLWSFRPVLISPGNAQNALSGCKQQGKNKLICPLN